LVGAFDVLAEPVRQEMEDLDGEGKLSLVELTLEAGDLDDEERVLAFVLFGVGKTVAFEIALFGEKMGLGIADQAIDDRSLCVSVS
jgi:hypothetical protein